MVIHIVSPLLKYFILMAKYYGTQCNQLTAFIDFVRRPVCPIAGSTKQSSESENHISWCVLCSSNTVEWFQLK